MLVAPRLAGCAGLPSTLIGRPMSCRDHDAGRGAAIDQRGGVMVRHARDDVRRLVHRRDVVPVRRARIAAAPSPPSAMLAAIRRSTCRRVSGRPSAPPAPGTRAPSPRRPPAGRATAARCVVSGGISSNPSELRFGNAVMRQQRRRRGRVRRRGAIRCRRSPSPDADAGRDCGGSPGRTAWSASPPSRSAASGPPAPWQDEQPTPLAMWIE